MHEYDKDEFRELLKKAIPPVVDAGSGHDRWPAMLRKLDTRPRLPAPAWWEWALLGLIPISIALFPKTALALLIQI